MSNRKHPPLGLLEPFEAAARLGSFTNAADELSVTQSAISQRVRKLEELLELKLFERRHRSIELTPEGRELLNGVAAALRHLTSTNNGLRQHRERPVIKVGADTSIAQFWLLPRLKAILSKGPSFDVNLMVTDAEEDLLNADVAILHGDGSWPNRVSELLFQDEIFPVCSPSYLDSHPFHNAEGLASADLIDLDYTHWNWINWSIWFTEAGLKQPEARVVLRTNSYAAQIDAALEGLGVALGWNKLHEDSLQSGELIRPIPQSVFPKFGYYISSRKDSGHAAQDISDSLFAFE